MPLSPQYIAGFFDGEGCIVIKRQISKSGGVNHTLRVSIPQVNPVVVRELYATYGGNLCVSRHKSRRDIHRWQVDCKKAVNFLVDVLPYLVNKKVEAELAIQFQETKQVNMYRRPVDLATIQIRDAMRERLSALKWVEWVN